MNCKLFVYDEESGDQRINLRPGTKVGDIPDSYRCPVCAAPKSYLQPVSDAVVTPKKVDHGEKAVRIGFDVLEIRALGADVALIGRPLAQVCIGGGYAAVKPYFDYVKDASPSHAIGGM